MNNSRDRRGNEQSCDPTVIACVVFQTQTPERLVELLRQALVGIPDQARAETPSEAMPLLPDHAEDPWLKHTEAAEYLGISRSTLYRYAEQERIESSKFGNRLEYRRSSLDRFKDQHVRPARRSPRGRGIIRPALSSGN
jgi:excisionase family DNA binding protein